MENLPQDVTFTTGPHGPLSFGIDRNMIIPETNMCTIGTMGNPESNSESLLSSSILNHSSYASMLSYNVPVGGVTLTEFKSNAAYGETTARMYPSRLHPGRSSLAFPQETLTQRVLSVGWPTPSVCFHPSSVISANENTIPHTSEDSPLSQIDMDAHMMSPLRGNFAISLPPRSFQSQETAFSASWIPALPSLRTRTTPCGNLNPTLNQNAMLVGNEKSTPSQVISALNISAFLNLPSRFERSLTNGIPSSENVQTTSVGGCNSPPSYSSVDTVTSHTAHSNKFKMAGYINGSTSDLTGLSINHTTCDADSQERVCGTVFAAVVNNISTKKPSLGSSVDFEYSTNEIYDNSLTVSMNGTAVGQGSLSGKQDTPGRGSLSGKQDTPRQGSLSGKLDTPGQGSLSVKQDTHGQSTNLAPNGRQQNRKYEHNLSTKLWYDCCKSKEITGNATPQLKGMPERESSVTSDTSGDTDILDHAEDGNQESRLIDECNETDTLTNQEERQRNYTEPVVGQATNNVYDSLSQGTDKLFANDKLHDEHTFSTSTQFDNDPASYSSSSLAQMRTTESNINNDGLWSQEIANSGLHGNSTSSTEVSNQSTAGPEDSTLSSLCQPVQDTTLSLFNISLLTPFAENVDVNVHIEENQYILVDGQRRWKCLMCPKIYSSKHNLVTHIFGHNGIKPHCCPVCGKLFKQTSHLQTHALTHSNIKPYSCQVCGRAFTQSSHVKRHMAVHMARRPHVCDLCDRGFVYPSELKAHREKHKNGDKDNACEKCGDTFESMQRLKQHKATVHKDVSDMTCSVCGKMFTYPSQLRDHMLKHGGKRPYICTECGMDFMKEHHLRAHQFTHTGLKPFTCITCCRSFNQKANLQRHQLIHQNLRRYRCNICGRDFSQPQVLKAHLVTHSSKKPHKCKICGKQFSRLHNLTGHVHMHKGTKPHVCFCGASFTLKGNLNRHCKEKHGQNVGASGATSLCREENQSTAEMHDGGFLLAAPVHLAVTRTSNEDSLESATYSTSVPKKKHRKSMPRKKIISQNGDVEDEEIEAAWRDENAADELHADPSRLSTYPTVVIPTKIQPTDVEKDDMNVELIDAIKQKKNVSDNHVMKPCNQIRNNIKNVSAGVTHVFTSVGRKQKPNVFVMPARKVDLNNSTTAKRTKTETVVVGKRMGPRRRSCRQVSHGDLNCNDHCEGVAHDSNQQELATCFSSSLKHGSEKKIKKTENNLDNSDQSCLKRSPILCGRKGSICNVDGMKQKSQVTETQNRDCSTNKTSTGGTNQTVGMQKKRRPRIGKKASLAALLLNNSQKNK